MTGSLSHHNFRISGFDPVKKAVLFLSILAMSWTISKAQGDVVSAPASFADSVRIALENSRNLDATVVGAGFFSIWNQLSVDQQIVVKKQSFTMRKRKFPLKTHMVHYYGALVNAISVEKV